MLQFSKSGSTNSDSESVADTEPGELGERSTEDQDEIDLVK